MPDTARYIDLELGSREVVKQQRGANLHLLSPVPLARYPDRLTDCFFATAKSAPRRVWMAQRSPNRDWVELSYGEAGELVERLTSSLRVRNLSADRPVAILSGSSLEHALLILACLNAGVPYACVTPAYSLLSADLAKLRHVLALLTPGLIFADDASRYERALECVADDCEIVVKTGAGPHRFTSFQELSAGAPGRALSDGPRPDDIAKFLFTSGSTGMPKAVIVTHRMWCANLQMFAQAMPFMARVPPVFVDWLPWHHTSGGNQSFGMTLFFGGSLYIDDGRPTRDGMPETVRNLKDIRPTSYFSVPKGMSELLPYLRVDPEFARKFFQGISMFFYSGAALPAPLLKEWDELSVRATGRRVPVMSAYGATETAPFVFIANWPSERTGLAGVPLPGVDAKLIPIDGKYEVRVKGPMATPGYWRQPDLTGKLYDEEGYLCLGDSLSFVDESRPELGMSFDGRIAEDFKLTTGTWVNVGSLRDRFLREVGLIARDVVITGENRDAVGGLVFLSPDDCSDLIGKSTTPSNPATHPRVLAHLQRALDRLAQSSTGSSTFISRVLIIPREPVVEAGEVTDKGSISQRRVLANRAAEIERLYRDGEGVIVAQAGTKSENELMRPKVMSQGRKMT